MQAAGSGFRILLACIFSMMASSAFAKDCLSLITFDNDIGKQFAKHVSIALTEKNICHQFHFFPHLRAPYLLDFEIYTGIVTPEIPLKEYISEKTFKIEPPLFANDGMLITKTPDLNSMSDLHDKSIVIIRGAIWMKELLNKEQRFVEVTSLKQAVNMFRSGHVDALLAPRGLLKTYKLIDYPHQKVADIKVHIYLKQSASWARTAVSDAILSYKASGRKFLNFSVMP